ncbi:hypothetical protein Ancab_005214 [Ancistrocladus abbreviatus]
MESLLSQSYPSRLLFQSSFFSSKNPNFKLVPHGKCLIKFKDTRFIVLRASSAANSTTYNGWDDPRIGIDSEVPGESNHLKKFLISLGIDDKKYIFMYIFGFVCALAISRVRVSSIVVLPATSIVLAIGFSFGFVSGGSNKGLNLLGAQRGRKEDAFRVHNDKLKYLGEIFDGFDVRVSEFKDDIRRALDSKRIEVGDLEGYVNAVESIRLRVLSARNVIDDCISSVLLEDQEAERNMNQRPNKKKKEVAQNWLDVFKFVWINAEKNEVGAKTNKKKQVAGSDPVIKDISNPAQGNFFASAVEERLSDSKSTDHGRKLNIEGPCNSSSYQSSDWNRKVGLGDRSEEIKKVLDFGKKNFTRIGVRPNFIIDDEELSYRQNRSGLMNSQCFTLKMSEYDEVGQWGSLRDNMDFRISMKHKETKASFSHEKMLRDSNGVYDCLEGRETVEHRSYGAGTTEERTSAEKDLHATDYMSDLQKDIDSSSSSMFSDDVLFDKYLTEASDLLKQAKECLKIRNDELQAENFLLECAQLLSKAIAMKPMSLLAVGQLGNTYLLHGELKLRISRELRSILYRNDNWRKNILIAVDDPLSSKDRIATLLINVCEECEELLVEAGKKYRMALSIDASDVRALYNWGLALSFRAQLIADIGPEAARDADKLFLAAIDKFDAMMCRSNVYAPDALFRWGVALQYRSRLRPSNSKDKVKLLQQARRLYEDAIDMGSDKLQICPSEDVTTDRLDIFFSPLLTVTKASNA